MSALAVVDDRSQRQIVVDAIVLNLPDGWEVFGSAPLRNLAEYPGWLMEHEVVALILDERLTEVGTDGGAVSYNGHDLVDFLRKHLPSFPIFIVTSYPNDPELEERFRDVEAIIPRREFNEEPGSFVPRFLRASQQYLKAFQSELAELSEFAAKSASGQSISDEEEQRARAIQTKLELAFEVDNITSRNQWISSMDKLLDDLDELRVEIETYINQRS